MIIVHKVDDQLSELFPETKQLADNPEVLVRALEAYYAYGPVKPRVEIKEDVVVIEVDDTAISKYSKDLDKLTRLAERGRYLQAKPLALKIAKGFPAASDVYRILGQIYFNEGRFDQALDQFIDALRWDPKNAYALVMMGNLYASGFQDNKTALRYYKTALELNPSDYLAANNTGGILAKEDKLVEAEQYFQKSIAHKADYPNSHYGLALVYKTQNRLTEAFAESIEALKLSSKNQQEYKIFYALSVELARACMETTDVQKTVAGYAESIERACDKPIVIEKDASIGTIAKAEIAEYRGRDMHRIKYKEDVPFYQHLVVHELAHIDLITQARKVGYNKLFTSSEVEFEQFKKRSADMAKKLSKIGLQREEFGKVCQQLFNGLNLQAYNAPIDLFIEDFIYRQFPELRPYQYVALIYNLNPAIEGAKSKLGKKTYPAFVRNASIAMGITHAYQLKDLYGADKVSDFETKPSERTAQKLYNQYLDMKEDRAAGEEYDLLQWWAEDLNISAYFQLEDDPYQLGKGGNKSDDDIEELLSAIEADPLGLKGDRSEEEEEVRKFKASQKAIGTNMAVVMYMVDALQYFKDKSKAQAEKVGHEIALLGRTGIDPSSDARWSLASLPNKEFSGYKLLAYMYVSWSVFQPELVPQLGLDFADEYAQAKQLFERGV